MTVDNEPGNEELWVRRAGGHENTYGIRVGEERYRVTATTLISPGRVRFGAVVQTVVEADGRRWVSAIAARSPYRSTMLGMSAHVIGSPELEDLKARIVAVGGMWEQLLRGILIIHVPPDSGVDPRSEIEGLLAAVGRNPARTDPEQG
jgi:hypothetical protein